MTYCNFTFYCNYSWKRNVKCFGHFNVKSQTLAQCVYPNLYHVIWPKLHQKCLIVPQIRESFAHQVACLGPSAITLRENSLLLASVCYEIVLLVLL